MITGRRFSAFALIFVFFAGNPASAQPDFSVDVTSTWLRDAIYLLEAAGGHQIASIGADGVLLVDASYEEMAEKIKAALHRLGGDTVSYVINTHWHPDHTDGNRAFGQTATVVAHRNLRDRLRSPDQLPGWAQDAVLPRYALPDIAVDSMLTLYVNGDWVRIERRALCHTNSDISVYFAGARVLHLGDAFIAVNAFPPINPREACGVTSLQKTLAELVENLPSDVVIVTGHGGTAGMPELRALRQMVDVSIDTVRDRMQKGWNLEQIQAEGLPDQFSNWGKEFAPAKEWLALVYLSLRLKE